MEAQKCLIIHLHHGLVCGLATPAQLEIFADAIPGRVRKIGEIFGADIPYDATPGEIGKITAAKLRAFLSLIGLPSLEKMGLSRKDVTDQTESLLEEKMLELSPVPVTREIAIKALNLTYDYQG